MRGTLKIYIFISLFFVLKNIRKVYKNMPFNNREICMGFYERNTYF